MRVLLVTEYFPPKIYGGGELSTKNLAKKLSQSGLEVSVLTSHFEDLPILEEIDGYKIFRHLKTGNPKKIFGNIKRTMFFQRSVRKEIKELEEKTGKFEVIHFLNTTSIPKFKVKTKTFATINSYTNFCPKANLFYKEQTACDGCNPTKFVGCITNSEFVGKTRMTPIMKYNPVFWTMLYWNYMKRRARLKNVGHYISISEFITTQLKKNGVKKISKIYNLPDLNDKGPKFEIKEKEVKVTFIGVLEKVKGVEMLVKSFRGIKGAKLLLFGDGIEKENLEKISGKNVKFYGKVDYKYIPSIYKQSDIIVQTALWPEPFSRIMLESAFFGKPIIATDFGGNSEGVIEGENGYLVKTEHDLREKIQKLVDNKELRKKFGKRSRKIYEEKFETEKLLKKIMNIYNKEQK